MTTADWFDYSSQAMANYIAFLVVYLTLVSSYLVIAFMVGKSLLRRQVALINTFFIAFSLFNLFAQAMSLRNALMAYSNAASGLEDMLSMTTNQILVLILTTAFFEIGIILACIKFMWDIRHPKSE
ncbi:MAG: hypothetical protein OEV88_12460 [Gammaproteobacteria bacterium]|nr:hypothetical protein [Gammaproteobacteria bacterium]